MGMKSNFFQNKEKQIPENFKQIAKDFSEKGFVTTSTENLINWDITDSTSVGFLCNNY